jgi:hypothetical protein
VITAARPAQILGKELLLQLTSQVFIPIVQVTAVNFISTLTQESSIFGCRRPLGDSDTFTPSTTNSFFSNSSSHTCVTVQPATFKSLGLLIHILLLQFYFNFLFLIFLPFYFNHDFRHF